MFDYDGHLGRYNVPFFCVHLNDEADASSYIHEYVHHIQNITTAYGMVYYFSRQCYFLHKYIQNKRSFLYPSVEKLWMKNHNMIQRVFMDLGSSKAVYSLPYHHEEVLDIKFLIKKEKLNGDAIPYIYGAIFKLRIAGKMYNIPFSVLMIKENMARLIQNRCFPGSKIAHNITYFLVEELVQKFIEIHSLSFPVDDATLLALCDLSLYADFPVHAFFSILSTFGKMNVPDLSPAFMYDYAFRSGIHTLLGHFSLQELLKKELDACCSSVDSFYKAFAPDTTISDWVKSLFNRGVNYRINNPGFLLNVMDTSKSIQAAREAFMGIVSNLGFTVEFYKDTHIRIPGNLALRDFLMLMALEEYVSQSLYPRKNACELQSFCRAFVRNDTNLVGAEGRKRSIMEFVTDKNNIKPTLARVNMSTPVVNNSCKTPWLRDTVHNLCPYTYIARNVEWSNARKDTED